MWLTVRLLLFMSILLELETTQIDYTAAFVHADIDCLIYVAMPALAFPDKYGNFENLCMGLLSLLVTTFSTQEIS
jgi:hypothetical protein